MTEYNSKPFHALHNPLVSLCAAARPSPENDGTGNWNRHGFRHQARYSNCRRGLFRDCPAADGSTGVD